MTAWKASGYVKTKTEKGQKGDQGTKKMHIDWLELESWFWASLDMFQMKIISKVDMQWTLQDTNW